MEVVSEVSETVVTGQDVFINGIREGVLHVLYIGEGNVVTTESS